MYCLNYKLFFYIQFFLSNNINILLNFNFTYLMFFFNKNFIKSSNLIVTNNKIKTIKFKLLFRFLNYFNIKTLKNLNFNNFNYTFYTNFNNKSFNIFNKLFFKNIINLIYALAINNINVAFIDKEYKKILPIYNYIFPKKSLILYKKFFFIEKNFFTFRNWVFFYLNFLKKFNIKIISILNFNHFVNFYKYFKILNLPITSAIPVEYNNSYVDYPVFFDNYNNNIQNFVFFNIITQIYMAGYNYNLYLKKVNFLRTFYRLLQK